MDIKLNAHCGCKWSVRVDKVISPHDVIHEAIAHAKLAGHTVLIEGEVRMPKKPHAVRDWRDTIDRKRQQNTRVSNL